MSLKIFYALKVKQNREEDWLNFFLCHQKSALFRMKHQLFLLIYVFIYLLCLGCACGGQSRPCGSWFSPPPCGFQRWNIVLSLGSKRLYPPPHGPQANFKTTMFINYLRISYNVFWTYSCPLLLRFSLPPYPPLRIHSIPSSSSPSFYITFNKQSLPYQILFL